jgi:hypothetical protein
MVICMIHSYSIYRTRVPALCLLFFMILILVTSGCTQTGIQSADQKTMMEVTAVQPDNSHIVITYQGGPDMEKIVELETTVNDSAGKSKTQSIGSRLATTPITIHGTDTFTGAFEGKDHVVVTGYFTDGSHKVLLDTTI